MGLNQNHRSGATLLEVLVSIFIMGIGLIALLVLFPLGAITMARAIQSDRAAQAAISASAIANVKDIRRDIAIYNPATGVDLYLNPLPGVLPNAELERKSYPVFIDPVGTYTAAGLPAQNSVGGLIPAPINLLLARTSVSFVNNAAAPDTPNTMIYRWFTSQDDIIFDKDGSAKSVVPNSIERDVRYSYAFLTQRPRASDPSVVDCAVVVYNARPTGLSGNLDLAEFAYYRFINASNTAELEFRPAENIIRIRYGGAFLTSEPPMRAGDWVLDVSVIPQAGGVSDRHAYFYRIAGIAEGNDAAGPFVDLETQQPLRGFAGAPLVNSSAGARLLFLEGVAEVFERGLGKEP